MLSCRFWIVTPSYRSIRWLPCAVASVADQVEPGIEVHHHVQDGGSDDGTREWLEHYASACAANPKKGYTFSYESTSDDGMYDAINRGWSRAPEHMDFIGHLNSDEQYLPHGLIAVAHCSTQAAPMDIVVGDSIVVDSNGRYICQQNSVQPWKWMSRFFCSLQTCCSFFRRQLIFERGWRFDPSWRIFGDIVFFHQLVQSGARVALCNCSTSVFVDSGENLALSAGAAKETARYRVEYVGGRLPLVKPIKRLNTMRRLWKGFLQGYDREYQIYLPNQVSRRTSFGIDRPTGLWCRKV